MGSRCAATLFNVLSFPCVCDVRSAACGRWCRPCTAGRRSRMRRARPCPLVGLPGDRTASRSAFQRRRFVQCFTRRSDAGPFGAPARGTPRSQVHTRPGTPSLPQTRWCLALKQDPPAPFGRPENCSAGGGGGDMDARRRRGGRLEKWGSVSGPFFLCKNGCWRQRHRSTKFGPKKFFPRIISPPTFK